MRRHQRPLVCDDHVPYGDRRDAEEQAGDEHERGQNASLRQQHGADAERGEGHVGTVQCRQAEQHAGRQQPAAVIAGEGERQREQRR